MTSGEKAEPKGSADSSSECLQGNGPHCRDHGWHCCHCGVRLRDVPEAPSAPEPSPEECSHLNKRYTGSRYEGSGRSFVVFFCPACRLRGVEEEPPLTPEEEEEAGCPHESWDVTGEHRDPLIRKWVKSRRCNDCGEDLDNVLEDEPHWDLQPADPSPPQPEEPPCGGWGGCTLPRGHNRGQADIPENHEPPPPVCKFEEGCHRVNPCAPGCAVGAARAPSPPQPGRRPPYAVSYSVQGHLYEVALPGDATVRAVDGALVIQHHLGPVAAICQVLPVINEEQG